MGLSSPKEYGKKKKVKELPLLLLGLRLWGGGGGRGGHIRNRFRQARERLVS